MLPDLSALDGSRRDFSALAVGGTTVEEINSMCNSGFTIGIGMSLEPAAKLLQQTCGIGYTMFDTISGPTATDLLLRTLSQISDSSVPAKYERQRNILIDNMRDAHAFFGGKKVCIALESDLAIQTSKWLEEMGASVELAVIPQLSDAADRIHAREVRISDLHSITGTYDMLIANSHAEAAAKRLGTPLYEMGFPVYKSLGYTSKITIGYRGSLTLVHEVGTLLMKHH
jgi:nitrogenase molybdenum-iron protein alpha/beta subunit